MKKGKRNLLLGAGIIAAGFLMILQQFRNPVVGATKSDYHPQSFWYYPWGTSVTHSKNMGY